MKPTFDRSSNTRRLAGCPLSCACRTWTVLPKLEKYVKEYDIKIAVHAHGPEDKNFQKPQDVLEVVKNMDPRCGLCIDIGHTVRTGVDLVSTVAETGPRLLDMHVKDLASFHGERQPEFRAATEKFLSRRCSRS